MKYKPIYNRVVCSVSGHDLVFFLHALRQPITRSSHNKLAAFWSAHRGWWGYFPRYENLVSNDTTFFNTCIYIYLYMWHQGKFCQCHKSMEVQYPALIVTTLTTNCPSELINVGMLEIHGSQREQWYKHMIII